MGPVVQRADVSTCGVSDSDGAPGLELERTAGLTLGDSHAGLGCLAGTKLTFSENDEERSVLRLWAGLGSITSQVGSRTVAWNERQQCRPASLLSSGFVCRAACSAGRRQFAVEETLGKEWSKDKSFISLFL